MPFTPTTTLQTLHQAGPPPALVRLQNLQTTTTASRDAWNRPNKPQPLLLNASVSFSAPFPRAGPSDTLTNDTLNYGTLSKTILASASSVTKNSTTLPSLVGTIWQSLCGHDPSQKNERVSFDCLLTADVLASQVRHLSVSARLPKATLLGSGVSYTVSACFGDISPKTYATQLCLHELRVPTLIGVNENERLARQFVIATVAIDTYGYTPEQDVHTEMEAAVVKLMEESSFETLEALARHIADHVAAEFFKGLRKQVHVQLEKPTAVPFAEFPVVEIRVDSEP
ncbi:Dihydroneopterin aldolase-domain-containing protein [Echria macrotheca]|uniref:dihydroneopterin aldolase n=1 Tax=Echria macrotheca TaxID=438768 RepID=A0AAJ0B660_9PEZI|nr:Dihydroneopterin aldolase-domain-containing protein [Echria macrotheca]